ncbi:hypothetical protein M885DRAFT_621082 [Pelagophyceae sp. CCMP2097]|nr:hypothetical protein M885DRAFT_621082 [Pelagophyceae sp. CCMP2097]
MRAIMACAGRQASRACSAHLRLVRRGAPHLGGAAQPDRRLSCNADTQRAENAKLYRVATLPNALSALRLVATPAIGVGVAYGAHQEVFMALGALAFTDWLDGYIARTFDQRSIIGSYLDPVADKALVSAIAIPLAMRGDIPAAFAAIVVARDVALLAGTALALRRARDGLPAADARFWWCGGVDPRTAGLEVTPTFFSKANTALQMATLGLALVYPAAALQQALIAVTTTTTLVSGFEYANKAYADGAAQPPAQQQQQQPHRAPQTGAPEARDLPPAAGSAAPRPARARAHLEPGLLARQPLLEPGLLARRRQQLATN